jgi:3'-phosphoadenosine 5'-phosphosulfate sulfotransferase (PAPS reductase)/FAD synthetase
MEPWQFMQKQRLPYEAKIRHAEIRAREFYDELNGDVFCSVGGLDSITLLLFLRKYVSKNIPAISVSVLEDKSIQEVHKQLGVQRLRPQKSKVSVIREFGFPVISKEKAGKIALLQNPTEKNTTVRNAIMTGDTGAYGGWRKGTRMKLPQKWLELFAGMENEKYGTNYRQAPFRVSNKCCYYLKEKPCDNYAKETGRKPYMGLMASEGGQREKALMKHGCNYYGKTTIRSCPFAIFNRQDLLQLALDLKAPVPKIYGEIVRDSDGTLRTTRAQRTGCTMCGFGIHIEKRPHRFDRLRDSNPKEWEFWMYKCVTDEKTGEKYGWGKVLDYIGVAWEDKYVEAKQLAIV